LKYPVPAGKTCRGQEFPSESCSHFRFHGPVSGIWKIRQMQNIFIPLYFHWNELVFGSGWGTGLQKDFILKTG